MILAVGQTLTSRNKNAIEVWEIVETAPGSKSGYGPDILVEVMKMTRLVDRATGRPVNPQTLEVIQ